MVNVSRVVVFEVPTERIDGYDLSLFSETLFKKRFQKVDLVAPPPHPIYQENKARLSNSGLSFLLACVPGWWVNRLKPAMHYGNDSDYHVVSLTLLRPPLALLTLWWENMVVFCLGYSSKG